jgi:hypothetical protein
VPGSPQHSINEFGRAKHGDGLFFGQSQWAHPVNRNSFDGRLWFHFPMKGFDDNRRKVRWICSRSGATFRQTIEVDNRVSVEVIGAISAS